MPVENNPAVPGNGNEEYNNIFGKIDAPEATTPVEPKVEVKEGTQPVETPVVPTPTPTVEPKETEKPVDKTATFPQKLEGESDVSYNIRQQLKIAQQAMEATESPEDKSILRERMKDLRKNLAEERTTNPVAPTTPPVTEPEPNPADEETIKNNLKKLGYLSKDEVQQQINREIATLRAEENQKGVEKAIVDFYKERPEILQNKEAREFLENYVWENNRIDINTTGEKLGKYFRDAAKLYFPKADTSANSQHAQAKVEVMSISGTNRTDSVPAKVDETTAKILKDAGWSDQDIAGFS